MAEINCKERPWNSLETARVYIRRAIQVRGRETVFDREFAMFHPLIDNELIMPSVSTFAQMMKEAVERNGESASMERS